MWGPCSNAPHCSSARKTSATPKKVPTPSFKDPSAFGTHSIAPSDRAAVVDVHTFAQAQLIPSTQLWQETYADLFAIGMSRLTWSHEDAHAFYIMLRHARLGSAANDAIHNTTCWLDAAVASPAPSTLANVAGWAENLRETAQCHVPVPTKNLSVNNIDGKRHATEGNDCGGKVVERDEAALQFFISHQ